MRHSDNLNGTFTNPLIFADYPDPDIIRVGADFYMVSSSFHHAPGIPVCHSRDLVNWRVVGHAYERLPKTNPAYSMQDGKVAYRGGSWAPCIRHHNGRFYIGFNTPDEGFFLCIAERPEGPYEMIPFHQELYDPGLFFDDDGRVYVFHAAVGICVSELTADARSVKSGPVPIYQTAFGYPFEGSHAYKRNGWYYVCVTSRGYNGLQLCLRSRNIHGPYEARVLSGDDLNYAGAGLHQGGFVELENGETWFFLFQDRDYVGRVPVLQPVHWTDGWPVFGDPQNYWKASVTCRKPSVDGSHPVAVPVAGDEFDAPQIGLQWEWSHNPDDAGWSLTERPGWLRIRAGKAADFLHARNTLTQRITGPASSAVTRLDVRGLAEGDIAGLAIANIPYAFIAAARTGGEIRARMVNNGRLVAESAPLAEGEIFLKANADADGHARFFFGTDGEALTSLGEPFLMEFTVKTFLGNRFGLFCYNAGEEKGGCADFDFLRREPLRPALEERNSFGGPQTREREFLFVKNKILWIRDRITTDPARPYAAGPIWQVGNLSPAHGANWFDTWIDTNLIFWFVPKPYVAIETISDPQPKGYEKGWKKQYPAVLTQYATGKKGGGSLVFDTLLRPHKGDKDASEYAEDIKVLHDQNDITLISVDGDLLLCNPTGKKVELQGLTTDCKMLYATGLSTDSPACEGEGGTKAEYQGRKLDLKPTAIP